MTIVKILIATVTVCVLLTAAPPVSAQDGAIANDQNTSSELANDKFTVDALKTILTLEQHQVDFINELHKEAQERLRNEQSIVRDNPGIFRNHALNIRRETRERIREVLHPDQLNTYEEYYARELEREAQMIQDMPTEVTDDVPHEHSDDTADGQAK